MKGGNMKIVKHEINLIDNLEFLSRARWPLDSSAPFLKGSGKKYRWDKYLFAFVFSILISVHELTITAICFFNIFIKF